MEGRVIRVRFRRALSVSQGKLLSGGSVGTEVHAATFLTRRVMILDSSLLEQPAELRRILIHELFHFVWRRLGNTKRRSWHEQLAGEFSIHARGELGWSSEWRKRELTTDDVYRKSRRWSQYVCESFCDSAAWLHGPPHPEHTLARRFCNQRKVWFTTALAGPLPV